MTVRSVPVLSESASVGSRFDIRSADSVRRGSAPRRSPSTQTHIERSLDRCATPDTHQDFTQIWGGVLEVLRQGVIVVSRNLQPVYWNQKADQLCQAVSERGLSAHGLPSMVAEVCHRLARRSFPSSQRLVMECCALNGQTIRVNAHWLSQNLSAMPGSGVGVGENFCPSQVMSQSYILVFLENCTDTLQEELSIEQKKYDLTDREAEIWMLLRQEYTYQEIARMLQISLNTVKTHVKNVYAKRRSLQGQEKFWCYE